MEEEEGSREGCWVERMRKRRKMHEGKGICPGVPCRCSHSWGWKRGREEKVRIFSHESDEGDEDENDADEVGHPDHQVVM